MRSSTVFEQDSRWNRQSLSSTASPAIFLYRTGSASTPDNQQFGSNNTWSASLTVPLNPANDVLLSYSEGFRAPTFNDLYYPQYGNLFRNPSIQKATRCNGAAS